MKKWIMIFLLLLPSVAAAKPVKVEQLEGVTLQSHYKITTLFMDSMSGLGLKNAADAWNNAIGDPNFITYTTDPDEANIWVSTLPIQDIVEGLNIYTINGIMFPLGKQKCFIIMNEHKRYNVETMTHEIGHCLSLAHQPWDKTSIMYPEASDNVRKINKATIKWLKKALKELVTHL